MALFDFVKEMGQKVNNYLDLGRELANSGVNIKDPSANLENGIVTVSGVVDNQADREKVILILGNISGVSQVNDNLEVKSPSEESDFYTVKSGDSLSKISKSYYGNPMKYREIFEANKPMLEHPDKIYPGQVLRIPKL